MRIAPALFAMSLLLLCFSGATARADPWFGWGDNVLEDRFADGDFDVEDRLAMRVGGRMGASDVQAESWVSLVGFDKQRIDGRQEVGGIVVVGLALDRIAAGPMHRVGDGPRFMADSSPAAPAAARFPPTVTLVAPALARSCVAAAWRAAGLGVDDARIDGIVARARSSAWLPETRMRALRRIDDGTRTATLATTDGTTYYDLAGTTSMLELRLTWRFDRLLYADDEPTLERVRLERQDARSRLASRALEVLFAWQRASLDAESAPEPSRAKADALLRVAEAEATLDVLTAGWFSERDRPPPPPDESPAASSSP